MKSAGIRPMPSGSAVDGPQIAPSLSGSGNSQNTFLFTERTLSVIAFGFSVAAITLAIVMIVWSRADVSAIGQARVMDEARHSAEMQKQTAEIRSELEKRERESRLLQLQVMDFSALLMRHGIKSPGDVANGPSGNLDGGKHK